MYPWCPVVWGHRVLVQARPELGGICWASWDLRNAWTLLAIPTSSTSAARTRVRRGLWHSSIRSIFMLSFKSCCRLFCGKLDNSCFALLLLTYKLTSAGLGAWAVRILSSSIRPPKHVSIYPPLMDPSVHPFVRPSTHSSTYPSLSVFLPPY